MIRSIPSCSSFGLAAPTTGQRALVMEVMEIMYVGSLSLSSPMNFLTEKPSSYQGKQGHGKLLLEDSAAGNFINWTFLIRGNYFYQVVFIHSCNEMQQEPRPLGSPVLRRQIFQRQLHCPAIPPLPAAMACILISGCRYVKYDNFVLPSFSSFPPLSYLSHICFKEGIFPG